MALGPDPHSYANFEEAVVTRLDLSLSLDFFRKVASGHADLTVKALKPGVEHVCLDAKALDVRRVSSVATGKELEYTLSPPTELSQLLKVTLPPGADAGAVIRVEYASTAGCSALQWLDAQQTQGKEHPLVFSQCQAICGRTLFPCQDTPAVKMPFGFKITVPLPLVAVASGKKVSAEVNEKKGVTTFAYEQSVPVMSYLVAFICGHLESRKVGPRSIIWVEPEIADATQKELEGITEDFITEAEKVCGSPYGWGRYDVAVLPKSFAYGGMENPCLSFFSSSLLTGDRSLLTDLAHEVAHSWSGNLVTNARWKDFWLNEGFTRYTERRILGNVYGKPFRDLLLMVGYNDLVKNIDMLCRQGSEGLTMLEPELDGIDPDEAFSRVPYEKGNLFLHYLEQVVGGEAAMTEWLTAYFKEYSGKSIQVADFKKHFMYFWGEKGVDLSGVDWEHWLHGTKLPLYDPSAHVDSSLLDGCRSLADKWLAAATEPEHSATPAGVAAGDLEGKKAQEVMLFLDHLINAGPGTMPADRLEALGELYKLPETTNVEVAFRWVVLNLKNKNPGILPMVEKFVSTHGRGAYMRPIYLALNDMDHDFAVAAFRRNEAFYQATVARTARGILEVGARLQMRVTNKRNAQFYARAARAFLQDTPERPAAAAEISITALGEAIGVAANTATAVEGEGVAEIAGVETGVQRMPATGTAPPRSCPLISVLLRKRNGTAAALGGA